MLRKSSWGVALAVISTFGLLLTPAASDAQSRGGRSGGGSNWHGGGNYGRYDGRGYGGFGVGLGIGYGVGALTGYGLGSPYGYYGSRYYGDGYAPYTYAVPATSYYAQPTYVAQPQVVSPPADYYGAYQQPAAQNTADIMVYVPDPNAQIWFQNYQTQQRGTKREFESATLQPDRTYTFHVRARWTQNGQPVDITRDVQARAGQQVTVDFNDVQAVNQANESLPPPRTDGAINTTTPPAPRVNQPFNGNVPASNGIQGTKNNPLPQR